jgi:hypothetical protein
MGCIDIEGQWTIRVGLRAVGAGPSTASDPSKVSEHLESWTRPESDNSLTPVDGKKHKTDK